jgi:hypothetical protein
MTQKRQRTDKSKYKHESTGDYCTCAAYVAEIMCRKNAENKNVGSLPFKFWNKKPWDWTFKKQLFVATKLIKEFGEEALVKAVNSDDFKSIFSLNHPKVPTIVCKFHKIVQTMAASNQKLDTVQEPEIRKSTYGKKSKLQLLRNAANGQNKTKED